MDLALLKSINEVAGQYDWLDRLIIFFAQDAIIALGVLVALLWFMSWGLPRRKNQYSVVLAIESFLLSRLVIAPLVYLFFPRPRPFLDHNLNVLIPVDPLGASLPSGHAAMAFALALPVFIYNKKAGSWLMILALLISFSRIYVGVHYPSDVLAAFVMALAVVLFLNFFKKYTVAPVVRVLRGKRG